MVDSIFIEIYDSLLQRYGRQHWWPADSALEMIVGAVLTQNTSWRNVELAIAEMKNTGVLDYESLLNLEMDYLATLIRSTGYYNRKAVRLKNLLLMIAEEYDGSLDALLNDETQVAREKLLWVNGVGPETADAILLYGGEHPVFVVDVYTHRIFSRHNLLLEECSYEEIQERFHDNLPADSSLFNEYHALIVAVAKEFCKKRQPLCENCPLKGYLP